MIKWLNYHMTMWPNFFKTHTTWNSNNLIISYLEWKKILNDQMTKWLNYLYNRFKFKLPETPNDIRLNSLECTRNIKLPNDHTPSTLSKWPKTPNYLSSNLFMCRHLFSSIKRMVIWCLKWFSLVFEWMTKNTKLP